MLELVWKGGGPDAPPPLTTTNSPLTSSNLSSGWLRIIDTSLTTLPLNRGETICLRKRHGGWSAMSLLGKCHLGLRRDLFVCQQSSPVIRTISNEKKASVCLNSNPQDRFTLKNL